MIFTARIYGDYEFWNLPLPEMGIGSSQTSFQFSARKFHWTPFLIKNHKLKAPVSELRLAALVDS
jgi:hypothetical protein